MEVGNGNKARHLASEDFERKMKIVKRRNTKW
jgi:hypothetical protein